MIEQLIKNNGYSLAEVSENSLENLIKFYRYVTQNLSRQTSFAENTEDCLKVLNIIASYRFRKHDKRVIKSEKAHKDDEESRIINSFFVNRNASTVSERKWTMPEL